MSEQENPGAWQPPEPAVVPVEEYPFWDYKDAVLFLGAFVPSLLAAGLLVRLFFSRLVPPGQGQTPMLLATQFLAYAIWFAALYLILRTKYDRPFWKSLAWVDPWWRFPLHVTSGIVLAVAVAIGSLVLEAPDIDMPIKRLLVSRTSVLLVGLAAATAGPACEELAFRGFLFPLLARSLGPALGIFVTALPFALLHGPQYAWSWRHLMFIAIAGAAFGWKRYKSGSTAAAAIMHASYNITFFAAYVLNGKDVPAKW
jgi:hypothetical protein